MQDQPQPDQGPLAPEDVCRVLTRGPVGTRRLGRLLGEALQAGDVLLLDGPLGAGKTCLTQGLAEGLGIPRQTAISSPSFTLVNQYMGRLPLAHADLYRLEHPEELSELGLWEAAETGSVVVIEWSSRFPDEMPHDHLALVIALRSPRTRELTLRASGPKAKTRLVELQRKLPAEWRRQ